MTPLQQWVNEWKSCTRCPLHKTRTQVVHARGNVPADRLDLCDVLFIGEAPGDSEDMTGQPFAGPAGFLLDDIISKAVPEGVYYTVANLTGCIPKTEEGLKSGKPDHDEIQACRPRLEKFIRMCDPQLIVTAGELAKDYTEQGLKSSVAFHKTIPMVSIIHPSFIITRMPLIARGNAVRRCIITVSKGIETHVHLKGV